MWKIKKELIIELLNAAKKSYPNEFICFLGGSVKKEEITEFVFLPNESDTHSASVNALSIPFDDTIIGSLHSHPNSTSIPSNADKKLFTKYHVNLILGYPFLIENIGAYDKNSANINVNLI